MDNAAVAFPQIPDVDYVFNDLKDDPLPYVCCIHPTVYWKSGKLTGPDICMNLSRLRSMPRVNLCNIKFAFAPDKDLKAPNSAPGMKQSILSWKE
mmetsp:Transcript_2786/g.7804  ORF Transcript_2786/g.7804 Transcript_2786/m.7804 type:complete len:95 (+) Transcript_2786:2439-2723(+)